jgi:hypothetical protein
MRAKRGKEPKEMKVEGQGKGVERAAVGRFECPCVLKAAHEGQGPFFAGFLEKDHD